MYSGMRKHSESGGQARQGVTSNALPDSALALLSSRQGLPPAFFFRR